MRNDGVIQKMEALIREYRMICAGDHIIAGVSGGADSLCLLLGLMELREVLDTRYLPCMWNMVSVGKNHIGMLRLSGLFAGSAA